MRGTSHRSGTIAVSLLLTTSLAAPALADDPGTAASIDDPVAAAAGWLAGQLEDGAVVGQFGPDAGLTADVVFALAAAGAGADAVGEATAWLATQVDTYTGPGIEEDPDAFSGVFAGATAKLALAAATAGADPRSFGDVDLVARLEAREQTDGRLTDDSSFGDFSSTLTQALGVLALDRAGAATTGVTDFLLAQQCDDGGFRADPDADDCVSSVDSTGFAVQALTAADQADAAARAADWLTTVQGPDGGFDGGFGVNTNSTGLAAVAFALTGRDEPLQAARGYLAAQQLGCEDERAGAIRFDAADGGDAVRATAQALPGLTGVALTDVTISGARSDAPAPACDAPAPAPVDAPAAPDDDRAGELADDEPREGTEAADGELPRTGAPAPALLTVLALALLAAGGTLVRTGRSAKAPARRA